jgi:hypothetical protein
LGYDGLLQGDGRSSQNSTATFTRADGQVVHAEVSGIAANGISLKTEVKPPVGEFLLIAQVAGRVARHHVDGIVVDFIRP